MDSWALQGRRGISPAAVLAAVIVVTAGVTAVYLYPTLAGAKAGGNSSSTATTTNTTTFPVTTSAFPTSYSTTTFYSASNTTSYPFTTTTTSTSEGWQAGTVANMTLYYYKVLPLVKVAYNYSIYISQTGASPVLVSAIVGLYGPMIMRGNWTTGYSFSFPYRSVLNVTFQYTPPNTYQVINFVAQNYSVPGYFSFSYNTTQQKAISIALANSTVRSFNQAYPSYVEYAGPLYDNLTFTGKFEVFLFQVDGAHNLAAYVDMSAGAVVSTSSGFWGAQICYPNGFCYDSPWRD